MGKKQIQWIISGAAFGILLSLTGCGPFFSEDFYSYYKNAPPSELSFSHKSGFYPSEITISLSSSYEDDEIYYTLDGSPPGPDNYSIIFGGDIEIASNGTPLAYTERYRYDGPITITTTTMVRARVYNGVLPGPDVYNTYFINEDTTLPVFSLAIDPADLFDDNTGIYVKGNNPGVTPDSSSTWVFNYNFYQDWERPVHMEYYDENRNLALEMNAGVGIFGAASRNLEQKSLALFARSNYGPSVFSYAFFGNTLKNNLDDPIRTFKSILLRNSGDDWYRTMIRDATLQGALDGMDVDRQAYKPSIVFINGEYYGIHNIREKINEDYLAAHYDYVDPKMVDILESYDSRIVEGSDADFLALKTYITTNRPIDDTEYGYITSKIDISNFIDYFISQIYYNNTDWPYSNIKYWKPQTADGKWRWITFDLDGSFGGKEWVLTDVDEMGDPIPENDLHNNYDFDSIQWVLDEDGSTDSATLFGALFTNPTFKADFKARFNGLLTTNFSIANMENKIDSYQAAMFSEISDHDDKWGDLWDYANKFSDFRDFAASRHTYVSGTMIPLHLP